MPQLTFNLWPGGRTHALTMSYDDGVKFDPRLADIFDAHGIRGTFHLNSNYPFDGSDDWHMDAAAVRSIAQRHELSLHMHTHPFPTALPLTEVVSEVELNRAALEPLAGYPLRGMSYPYGDYNAAVVELLRALNVEYSRTTLATNRFDIPEDFLKWHPTCHHKGIGDLWEKFIDARYASKKPQLFYLWGHSYEFDRDDNWDLIESFCAKAGGHSEIWYATNIEIVDYVNAVRALKISQDHTLLQNTSGLDVYLSVDGKPVCVPAMQQIKLEGGSV